jgi:hypothetical protein
MMETIPSIIIVTFVVIASIVIISGILPATQVDNGTQKTSDSVDQQATMQGSCADQDCVMQALKECQASETRITRASNATTIITVGDDGVYQGKSVCMISIYEENGPSTNTTTSFQSWSCKVPVAELNSSSAKNFDEQMSLLLASEHCALQAP